MSAWTTKLLCPFCRHDFTGFSAQLCGGSFLDRDHPSAVRPVLVDVTPAGEFADDTEQRLADARATHAKKAATSPKGKKA